MERLMAKKRNRQDDVFKAFFSSELEEEKHDFAIEELFGGQRNNPEGSIDSPSRERREARALIRAVDGLLDGTLSLDQLDAGDR